MASGARFVRQFALTGGRAAAADVLAIETMVMSTLAPVDDVGILAPEHEAIIELARQPVSIAEVAAHIRLHLGVARVLVADLIRGGHLSVVSQATDPDGPDLEVLERLLDAFRKL